MGNENGEKNKGLYNWQEILKCGKINNRSNKRGKTPRKRRKSKRV